MRFRMNIRTAFALATLAALPCAAQQPKAKAAPAPAEARPKAPAAGTSAAPAATPVRYGDPRLESIRVWMDGYFPWGAGDVTVEEMRVKVPGYRLYAIKKIVTADNRANDQAYVAMPDDGGPNALVGDLFADEERAKAPAPIRSDADLGVMRQQLKRFLRGSFRLSLDPTGDRKSWKGLKIQLDSGYGGYDVQAYISADDGVVLLMGRPWDLKKSFAEQRKAFIKLANTPFTGPADATITIVEYSDMQCPYCRKRTIDWETLADKLKGTGLKIKRYFKAFPLTFDHQWAFRASSAGRCFYEVKPELFLRWKSNVYSKQDDLNVAALDSFALDFALANDISEKAFTDCYLKDKANQRVHDDLTEGFAVRVRSAPTYMIDGVALSWYADNLMEEYLRKTYLGGKGLPLPPPPTPKAGAPSH